MIRVLLAEDQALMRKGLVTLLNLTPDIRVIAEASDGDEAYNLAFTTKCDVALLDMRMPLRSGTQVLRDWKTAHLSLPAIMLTTFDEDHLFLDAVHSGARGFLLKDISVEKLADAIYAVARGELLLQPVVTERVMRIARERQTTFDTYPLCEELTSRERDVLRLMAAGFSNREIAESLRMSEGYAKNTVSNILGKLGVRDRTRAVLRGIELGLL